jgi:uncharacterized 2Fe-2S/4Fe-4S cluster protein (DUF4445 family)
MELRIGTKTSLTVKDAESIYETLKRNGIYLVSACGGKGTCGKCKVKIIEGDCDVSGYGKLDEKERKQGLVLACQAIAKSDISIEIPLTSRLSVGDKIAISRTKDIFEEFCTLNIPISSPVTRISIQLTPPTLKDSMSDLERLKAFLRDRGLNLSFSEDFVKTMPEEIRKENWHFNLCYEEAEQCALFIESVSEKRTHYGLAIDIGTTTVVMYLVSLKEGTVIDVGSTYNSQMRYGDDVITRIVYASESKGKGLVELSATIIMDLNILINSLVEKNHLSREELESIVLAGNTTMTHLMWGINPESIRKEPYVPPVQKFPVWSSKDAGLKVKREAPVYTLPCVASYMGADIVAGVLATGMYKKEEIALLMDIGTNGEIVIGNNDWLISASCSAGPCFEGGVIKHGMRATEGAIERIKIDPLTFEPELGIISNTMPLGICGSGMIDALSEMFLTGLINKRGKFVKTDKTDRVREGEDGREYFLFHDENIDIVLTEVDIENIIRAKAAIYAGVSLLIKEVGLTLDAIDKVYVGGGFGNYLDINKAIILGMLPDMSTHKFIFLGNTSIAGAYLCLLSREMRKEAENIASKMTYMELSTSEKFMDEYISAMFLPHTDMKRFPGISKMLSQINSTERDI